MTENRSNSPEPALVGDLMPAPPSAAERGRALARALASTEPPTDAEVGLLLDRDTPTMLLSDAIAVVSAAAAIDNRHVTEIQAQEWAYALAGLTSEECLAGIRRARQDDRLDDRGRDEYLTPAVVRRYVGRLRAERVQAERIARFRQIAADWESGRVPAKMALAELEQVGRVTADTPVDVKNRVHAHLAAEDCYQTARCTVDNFDDVQREQAKRAKDRAVAGNGRR